jgi:hypothetical protein
MFADANCPSKRNADIYAHEYAECYTNGYGHAYSDDYANGYWYGDCNSNSNVHSNINTNCESDADRQTNADRQTPLNTKAASYARAPAVNAYKNQHVLKSDRPVWILTTAPDRSFIFCRRSGGRSSGSHLLLACDRPTR